MSCNVILYSDTVSKSVMFTVVPPSMSQFGEPLLISVLYSTLGYFEKIVSKHARVINKDVHLLIQVTDYKRTRFSVWT